MSDFFSDWQVHGFAAQAVIKTSANRWFGDSETTSFGLTELGVNFLLPVQRRWHLSGQVMSRRAGDMYDGRPAIDYGLVDWEVGRARRYRLGLRLGRVKNRLGLYNETRDVPFTRSSIFLPQVVYFDKVRELFLSADGGTLYADWFHEMGSLSFSAGAGRPLVDENVETTFLLRDFDGDFNASGPAGIASLWLTSPTERWRFGLSGVVATFWFDPAGSEGAVLSKGSTRVLYGVASLQFNAAHWSVAAEYMRERIAWRDYGMFFSDRNAVLEGYYLEGSYRPTARLQAVLRYEEGFADHNDHNGESWGRVNDSPSFAGFSKILTAGVRVDIGRFWLIRADYQYHHGTFILSERETANAAGKEYWHLFAGEVGLRF